MKTTIKRSHKHSFFIVVHINSPEYNKLMCEHAKYKSESVVILQILKLSYHYLIMEIIKEDLFE